MTPTQRKKLRKQARESVRGTLESRLGADDVNCYFAPVDLIIDTNAEGKEEVEGAWVTVRVWTYVNTEGVLS